jgi:glycosyltransferase involved in cell wall biosynthesis
VKTTRLIVIGPIPPPVHGVAVSTSLVLANPLLPERFDVVHIDTTDPEGISNMGKWNPTNLFLGLRSLFRLAWLLRGRPGIVYLPMSENMGGFTRDSLFICLSAARGWKTTVHNRNSLFRNFYDAQGLLFRAWIRFTLRRITALAVLGESIRHLFSGLVPEERIAVVQNGTPSFDRGNLEPDPHRVLYLSNLVRKKGADFAVKSALLVLERDPHAEFVFAGAWEDEGFEHQLRSLAASANGRITFLPPCSGIAKRDLMASAWVLLFPVAWGEGHPRIILEALAAGLPVVTTDRATIAETVGDGVCGFVLEDPVPEELAERLLLILRDEELRNRMSAAARARHHDRFTQEQADRSIADWLSRVAKKA